MDSFLATRLVIDILEDTEIPYVLVGALASNVYSVARSTRDADIVVELTDGDLSRIKNGLSADFDFDPQMMFEVMTNTLRNQIVYRPTGFLIDLFRLSDDPHHRSLFSRRVRTVVPELNLDVWIPTVEDIIIQKLRWGRRKDQDDVVSMLATSAGQLDNVYVSRWTDQHDTSAALQLLRDELPDDLSDRA